MALFAPNCVIQNPCIPLSRVGAYCIRPRPKHGLVRTQLRKSQQRQKRYIQNKDKKDTFKKSKKDTFKKKQKGSRLEKEVEKALIAFVRFFVVFVVFARKNEVSIFDIDIQGFEEFSFGSVSTCFAALDAVDGQDRDTCFAREFSFADHLFFAYFFEIVFFCHVGTLRVLVMF